MTDDLALLTSGEAGALLHCSPRTVERLAKRGLIKATHVGGLFRIYRSSLNTYLEVQRVGYRPKGSRATFGDRTHARAWVDSPIRPGGGR